MIGPRIAVLRREAGLNQQELAKRLGISPSAVGMYEQGRREPSAQMLVAMAEVFGVSTDFLLTGRMACPQEARTLERILRAWIARTEQKSQNRPNQPFSGQELAVLMAAMLLEQEG